MVAWDADGDDDIQDVWVRVDWGDWLNATYNHTDGEGQWWYYEWDTTLETEGEHHISAIVYDGLDYGDDLIGVIVDNVPENNAPGIEIVEPAHGETVSGTIVIWMVAWDADGNNDIQDVWVTIDDGALRNATYNHTDGEGQWWYYEWDTTEVDDGWHWITAIVFDGMDDGSDVIEIFVDNIPENHAPGIEIMEPAHGETISGTVTIWMLAWDLDGNDEIQDVWVRIDGGALRNATFHHEDGEGQWWYYEWDTTEVDDGWHGIKASVFDGMDDGHDIIEVYVQNEEPNHAPGIEIVEPAHGETISGTITIWMVAWDPDGNDEIENVWVRIDGGALRNATFHHEDGEGQWWYYEWDTTEVDDGWHWITAIVFDGMEDASDIIEIIVDNGPENHAPGIEIVEPGHGDTVSGTITIWMVAWDPDGNDDITNVWVRIDGGALREATYHHEDGEGLWWYYEWDTTEVDNGWHAITAIVYDGVNDGHDTIEVYVYNEEGENHAPGIEIVEPDDGDTVSGTIVIWMVAWDPDGNEEIENVWVRIDDGDLLEATYDMEDGEGQWWYFEWDTTEVDNGWHLITAIVFDGMDDGHDAIEVHVFNEVENHAPQIEIVEPGHGDTVSGVVVIWMVAWDPDGNDEIENVWVRIDGGDLLEATFDMEDGEGQWWYFEWDTTEVDNGWHDITAVVFDGIDDGHDIIEVHVFNGEENHAPGIEIVEPEDGTTVSGTVVIWMVAWDPDGDDDIENVWVRFDDGDLLETTYDHTDGEGQWWFFEWDTTGVDNGWHLITAIVFDGNDDGHHAIEVHVHNAEENHAPGIEITEPEHGATVSGTVVIWMVAWDEDDNDEIENVWVRIDGGDLLEATYHHKDGEGQWWFFEWDTTEVEDGWHVIKAIVFDGADDGHDVIEVLVDNVEPNHAPGIVITEPEHGDNVSGTVVIWMNAWDEDGHDDIENVWVRIDDGDLLEATYNHTDGEGQWWYFQWDTTKVDDDWHSITAVVYDGEDDGHDVIEVFVLNEEEGFLSALILLLLAILTAMGLIGAVTATEVGKVGLLNLIVLPLYTKISKKDILDHFVRGEIFGYIKVNPGDNYTTIKKNLDLNNGTLTYHLSVLEREGLIKSWNHNGHKYFYPKGVKIPGNGVKNPSILDAILKSIKDSPGITVKDIAAITGISRQLANYHVRRLAAEGQIELERKSLSKICYLSSQTKNA
jgi:predicted transcriptional regulator